jgi:uracil-DNA glycosylase
VFGEGPNHARVMMIGQQPGHEGDLAGRPFVGPAGRLLDRALLAARIRRGGISRMVAWPTGEVAGTSFARTSSHEKAKEIRKGVDAPERRYVSRQEHA